MDTELFLDLGPWIGFLFSLMVFSAISGDNFMARLSQHILVGASLGYAAIMAVQYVLWPRLFQPLVAENDNSLWLSVLLGLGLLLVVAGIDRTYLQTTQRSTHQVVDDVSSTAWAKYRLLYCWASAWVWASSGPFKARLSPSTGARPKWRSTLRRRSTCYLPACSRC